MGEENTKKKQINKIEDFYSIVLILLILIKCIGNEKQISTADNSIYGVPQL